MQIFCCCFFFHFVVLLDQDLKGDFLNLYLISSTMTGRTPPTPAELPIPGRTIVVFGGIRCVRERFNVLFSAAGARGVV